MELALQLCADRDRGGASTYAPIQPGEAWLPQKESNTVARQEHEHDNRV